MQTGSIKALDSTPKSNSEQDLNPLRRSSNSCVLFVYNSLRNFALYIVIKSICLAFQNVFVCLQVVSAANATDTEARFDGERRVSHCPS